MSLTMKDVMTANCAIPHAEMLTSNHCAALARELNKMIAAAPTQPNPIACHVDETGGQSGGEVEVLAYLTKNGIGIGLYFPSPNIEVHPGDIELVDRAHVTRLQAERDTLSYNLASAQHEMRELTEERDAFKAEVEKLRADNRSQAGSLKAFGAQVKTLSRTIRNRERHLEAARSRLTQATAIIDYLSLHTELDAIAKSDIDKFYAGSTDAEKAARAEMVRAGNEPAGDGGYTDYDLHKDGE